MLETGARPRGLTAQREAQAWEGFLVLTRERDDSGGRRGPRAEPALLPCFVFVKQK